MSWSYLKMAENLQNGKLLGKHGCRVTMTPKNKLGYKYLSHSLFICLCIDRHLSCLSLWLL